MASYEDGKKKRKKKRPTIMRSLKIDEISAVDRPAQEGARVVLMKRDEDDELAKGMFLTTSTKGHAHLIDVSEGHGGRTSHEKSTGDEFGHSHPWVMDADGSISIGDAGGHGHEATMQKIFVDKREFSSQQRERLAESGAAMPDGAFPIQTKSDLQNAISAFGRSKNKSATAKHIGRRAKALGLTDLLPESGKLAELIGKAADDDGGDGRAERSDNMTDTTKKDKGSDERIEKLESDLRVAKAFGELTDEQKAHYAGLGKAEKSAFLDLGSDARQAQIDAQKADDPVIYKDANGAEYRKSDDPRMVDLAKRADAEAKTAADEREKRENAELAKRADSELDKCPGNDTVKVALLKAVDGIQDDETRKGVLELLKAANGGLGKAFEKVGTSESGNADGDPNAELEKLAQEHAKANKVSIEVARDAVLKTAAGEELYAKTIGR